MSRALGYSSSNHAPSNDSAEDGAQLREIADLKKRADALQTKSEKMRVENGVLIDKQKRMEKDRTRDQKKLESLQLRIGSADEVEKATAMIPSTLKKMEEALSGQRISLAQVTKQQASDAAKSHNTTMDLLKSLTSSVTSVSTLLSKVETRMDKLEGVLAQTSDKLVTLDRRSNEAAGNEQKGQSKKGCGRKRGKKAGFKRKDDSSTSSSEMSSPAPTTKKRDSSSGKDHRVKGTGGSRDKAKKRHKTVPSDSGNSTSDCVVEEGTSDESDPPHNDKKSSKSSKKRRSEKR